MYRILVTWGDHFICSLPNILSFFHCSFAYSHMNDFGRNQKLNISLERGQIDSIFRINYIDPWIEGDDKQISRTMMVQVSYGFALSRTITFLVVPTDNCLNWYCFYAVLTTIQEHQECVHGNQPDNSNLTIGCVTAGIEFSWPIRPKWSGTAGLIFQVLQ